MLTLLIEHLAEVELRKVHPIVDLYRVTQRIRCLVQTIELHVDDARVVVRGNLGRSEARRATEPMRCSDAVQVPPDVGPLVVEIPVTRGAGTKPGASSR